MHSPIGIVLLAVCDRQSPIHRDSPIGILGGPRPGGRKDAISAKIGETNEVQVNVMESMKSNDI